jgi:hypothetical protein
MLAFMLVDILPLIFKTFSPFTMYDKILVDDAKIFKELEIESRKTSLQKAYNTISSLYVVTKGLDRSPVIDSEFTKKYNLKRNIYIGVVFGAVLFFILKQVGIIDEDSNYSLTFIITQFLSIPFSILANFAFEQIKKHLQ